MLTAPRRLVLLSILLWPGLARAETPAERLFREGRAAMLEGRFEEACPKIAESQQLEPRVGTLLNLAACHERQGKLAHAFEEYRRAEASARTENQPDRARLAAQRIAILEPRVPLLRVTVPPDRPDLLVTLDGEEVEPVALGVSSPIEVGAHVVVARAGGSVVFEERIEVREGERRNVTVASSAPPPTAGDLSPRAPSGAGPTPEPKRASAFYRRGFLVEPSLFGAVLSADYDRPRSLETDTAQVVHVVTGEVSNCNSSSSSGNEPPPPIITCETNGRSRAAAAFGVGLVARYAFHEQVSAGLRGHLGRTTDDGVLWTVGPSVAVALTRWLELGGWIGFGETTYSGTAEIRTQNTHVFENPDGRSLSRIAPGHGSTGNWWDGLAAGAEITFLVPVAKLGRLAISVTPTYMSSDTGQAFVLPAGLGYRFE